MNIVSVELIHLCSHNTSLKTSRPVCLEAPTLYKYGSKTTSPMCSLTPCCLCSIDPSHIQNIPCEPCFFSPLLPTYLYQPPSQSWVPFSRRLQRWGQKAPIVCQQSHREHSSTPTRTTDPRPPCRISAKETGGTSEMTGKSSSGPVHSTTESWTSMLAFR